MIEVSYYGSIQPIAFINDFASTTRSALALACLTLPDCYPTSKFWRHDSDSDRLDTFPFPNATRGPKLITLKL